MKYSVIESEKLENMIQRDLDYCKEEILKEFEGKIEALWLIGGFARGECGVKKTADGEYLPANNYDFLLVVKDGVNPLTFNSKLENIKRSVNPNIIVPLEISWQFRKTVSQPLPLIIYKDIYTVGRTFYGKSPKELMNRRKFKVESLESLKILRNRGMLWLAAKERIDHLNYKANNQQIRIWLVKVMLGYADAMLIQEGRYVTGYVKKEKMLSAIDPTRYGLNRREFGLFRKILNQALHFRLYGIEYKLEEYIEDLNDILGKIHLGVLQKYHRGKKKVHFYESRNNLGRVKNFLRSIYGHGPLRAFLCGFLTKVEVINFLSYSVFYNKPFNLFQNWLVRLCKQEGRTIEESLIDYYVSELV